MGHRSIQRMLLVGLASFAPLLVRAQSPKRDPFWEPFLEQPIQQLEETLSQLKQQQPMNYTLADISFLYDAKLYTLFKQYLEKLPASKRVSALREQNQWLVERRKAMSKEDAEYEGGSMAPYAAGKMKIDYAKARIKVITERLDDLPSGS